MFSWVDCRGFLSQREFSNGLMRAAEGTQSAKPTPAFALFPAWDFLGLTILQNPAEAYLLLEGSFLLILPLSSLPLIKHFLSS